MKKAFSYVAAIGGIYLLSLAGCKKNDKALPEASPQTKTISATTATNDGMTVLGDKLVNPYTVANMEQARQRLEANGIHPKKPFTVRTTHLYVKFMPKDEAEYNALEADKSLDLVDFPLDYDIKVVGSHYREPGLDDNTPTPQYTTVPADFSFNGEVAYEILDRLYLPESAFGLAESDERDREYLRQLLVETYGLNPPNNRWPPIYLEPAQTGDEGGYGGGGPDGYVKVYDTRLNTMLPLKGADILVLNGMSFYHGTTDNNGQYWLDNWFSGNSIVLVKMRKSDFTIRRNFFDNIYAARTSNGTYRDIDIENGMERMYATMFRAAYRYYYGNVGGLGRPYRALFKQVIIGKDDNLGYGGVNSTWWPRIKISRFYTYNGSDVEFGSDEIFGITIHELAHTAHVKTMNAGIIQFNQVENRIVESWAVGVQWMVTNMEYRENGIANYGDWNYDPSGPLRRPHRQAYQLWNSTINSDYTNLFINLMDNINESTINFGTNINPIFGTVDDQISGYNFAIIQADYLKNIYGLSSLSTELKNNKPAGVTDAQIDAFLSNY